MYRQEISDATPELAKIIQIRMQRLRQEVMRQRTIFDPENCIHYYVVLNDPLSHLDGVNPVAFDDQYKLAVLQKLASLCSTQAQFEIIDHIFDVMFQVLSNGRTVGYEHHDMKKEGVAVDHHTPKELIQEEGKEPYWGLICASAMSAIQALLEINTQMLSASESKLDADQALALFIFGFSQQAGGVHESAYDYVLEKYKELFDQNAFNFSLLLELLDDEMGRLFQEEFSLFGKGYTPKTIAETVAELPQKEHKYYRDQGFKITLLRKVDEQTGQDIAPPIVQIQTHLQKLPVEKGSWNHIVTQLVADYLNKNNLSHLHEHGVVTVVVHGGKKPATVDTFDQKRNSVQAYLRQNKTEDKIQVDEIVDPEVYARPERYVVGFSTINNMNWDEQYQTVEAALATHIDLTERLAKIMDIHVWRNALQISTPKKNATSLKKATDIISRAGLNEAQVKGIRKQIVFTEVQKTYAEMGYEVWDNEEGEFNTYLT